jgi:hypothetical protein
VKVRVEEDSLTRLRMTAREWGVQGWERMTKTRDLRDAIEDEWRREVMRETRIKEHALHLRRYAQ